MKKNYLILIILLFSAIYSYGQCGDLNSPTITLTGGTQTIEACVAYTELGATANDLCDEDIILTGGIVIDATSVDTSTVGSYTVYYNVTDADGNSALQVTRTVNVVDTTSPTISAGIDLLFSTDPGICSASIAVPDAIFSDNCSGVTIAYEMSGATTKALTAGQVGTYNFEKGVTTITYTVTDSASNSTTKSKTVTVTDNENPLIPTLNPIIAECSVVISSAPTTTDNCAGTISATTGDYTLPHTFNVHGTFPITWAFNDGNGNVITVVQNVIIDDTVPPVMPTLTDITGGCSVTPTAPIASDYCEGNIVGTTTTPFPITAQGTTVVTWTYDDGNDNIVSQTQNVILTAPPISGGTLLGYVSDIYTQADATDNVAITSCPDDINPITIDLSGETGTIVQWEKFEAGDTSWSIIPLNTTYNNGHAYDIDFGFTTTKSTLFRVLVQVGTCTEYSNMVNVHAIPPDVPPILDETNFNICLTDEITLIARSGYTSTIDVGDGGDFNTGQFPDKWDPTQWKIDGEVAGTAWTAAADSGKPNNWSGTNDHPVGTLYEIEYDNTKSGKKFGIAHGNYTVDPYLTEFGGTPTTLETPIFSLVGLETASIDFDQAYNLENGDFALLELSLDGGVTYTITLQELIGTSSPVLNWDWANNPPSKVDHYIFNNDDSSFDISDYIGNDNVRVRWTFYGTTDESAWAIDNITIPVKPYSDLIEWTDGIGEPGEYIIQGELNVEYTFAPTSPGVHKYGATTLINGCRAYDVDGTAIATVIVNYAYAGEDYTPLAGECGGTTVALNAYDNFLTASENKANGAYPGVLDDFSDDPGTNEPGKWTIVSSTSTCGPSSFSDDTDPRATFSGEAGTHVLRWTSANCSDDITITLSNCEFVDFDGVDDYITFKNNYNINGPFSIEVWIKPEIDPTPASPIQTIFSKRNGDGYDLRLTNNIISFNWNASGSLASSYPITTNRWYHVAVTFNGTTYKIYIDGIEVASAAGSTPVINNLDCFVGAMDQTGTPPNKPLNHFSGWIDELRIWNKALNVEHIRQMMNQEITSNGAAVRGIVIPLDIYGPDTDSNGTDDDILTWSNLEGYYRMNNISCGYLEPYSGVGVEGKLRNITTAQYETAPMPYTTVKDGDWTDTTASTPWLWGNSVWDQPNSTGINGTPIDWNIVVASHNLNSGNKDITLLGLLLDTSGKELTITNPNDTQDETNSGQLLFISHYLKLDGIIDLVGESQLIQKRYTPTQFSESILEIASSGYLERDQQGQGNLYRYEDRCSPVGYIGADFDASNKLFTIKDVLRNGINPLIEPQPIKFIPGKDGSIATDPIEVSERWLYAFKNISGTYSNWMKITSLYNLRAAEGFTMKGSLKPGEGNSQNFVYKGKPHNGAINLTIGSGGYYLTGNPYPSALDADQFIQDNLDATYGVIYIYEDWGADNTHVESSASAGYATYSLAGGIQTKADNINNPGESGTKLPQRYIPVAQGFWVVGYNGGQVKFNNNQRVYITEADPESILFKAAADKKKYSNILNEDLRTKIRIGFSASNIIDKQLLLTIDDRTTDGIDKGFDAPVFKLAVNEFYWLNSSQKLAIQAVGDLSTERVFPIGITITEKAIYKIKVDAIENPYPNMEVFLMDNLTMDTYDIKNGYFEIELDEGEYDDKYSIVFKSKDAVPVNVEVINDSLRVFVSGNNTLISLRKPEKLIVKNIALFNMIGQQMRIWNSDLESNEIDLPINVSTGAYLVVIQTDKGVFSRKVLIN